MIRPLPDNPPAVQRVMPQKNRARVLNQRQQPIRVSDGQLHVFRRNLVRDVRAVGEGRRDDNRPVGGQALLNDVSAGGEGQFDGRFRLNGSGEGFAVRDENRGGEGSCPPARANQQRRSGDSRCRRQSPALRSARRPCQCRHARKPPVSRWRQKCCPAR